MTVSAARPKMSEDCAKLRYFGPILWACFLIGSIPKTLTNWLQLSAKFSLQRIEKKVAEGIVLGEP
jgi:hypothetical protein